MKTSDRSTSFELELRAFLDDEAGAGRPGYLADVLVRSAIMPQRPWWSFVGRWLPAPALGLRRPKATAALGPVLLLTAAAALILIGTLAVGGSHTQVPAPYGPATDGVIAVAMDGDIVTVDPRSGTTTELVTGSTYDSNPVFSRDGSALVFARGDPVSTRLVVVRDDGSLPVEITDLMTGIRDYSFSPDGAHVIFAAGPSGAGRLWIAATDGSGARQVDVPFDVQEPHSLPPLGADIVFASATPAGVPNGVYSVDVRTGDLRTILEPAAGVLRDVAAVSPDGSHVAYSASDVDSVGRNTYQVHVASIDGTGDRILPMPAGAVFQDRPAWSNDGTRIALFRGYAARNEDMVLAVVPADGGGLGVESSHGVITDCCDNRSEWSPSDDWILVQPVQVDGSPGALLLVDPATGSVSVPIWTATSIPSWQRRASP